MSGLEEHLERWFKNESEAVTVYRTIAGLAEEAGMSEVAETFRKIADEELRHAAIVARIAGKLSEDIKSEVERLAEREAQAAELRRNVIKEYGDEMGEDVRAYLISTAHDEERHAKMLRNLLERLERGSVTPTLVTGRRSSASSFLFLFY
ncbi:ferritin family protein [Methanopyrus sp. KOL6]|uniref:ferritin-like domain-containing protein n=1 Tax=Methanopyrus sp. KOL6 TaxID=1937004 RepID=UPI000B4C093E|nr:ferritin family protein [Methanopyrus sp. KOL6]